MNTPNVGIALAVALFCTATDTSSAQTVPTTALSENGWFSDDTRADGTGTMPAGTNLISDTLTDDPEGSASGLSSHDSDINQQIVFGDAVGSEPIGTFGGAVHLNIASGASGGKSQISHRIDDLVGHGPGAIFGPGFSAEYSWMGDGTPTVTASLKFGIKTAEFVGLPLSSRTGENVWDKVLIYEPGQGNGKTSDGAWHTETIDFTTGSWWFFDRAAGASSQPFPMSLSDMSTSAITFSGAKSLMDVHQLITAAGSIITSVQFGVGSGNPGASVYVNQLETNAYRAGMITTFGTPSPFDQDVTPDVIFGSGNLNGSYTVDRRNGVELGLRGKLRNPPVNQFNSNGDGTYTFNTGTGGPAAPETEWSFEWAINTNYDNTSSWTVGDLTYEIGMDNDPGPGTDFLKFNPISIGTVIPYTIPSSPVPFWDHSMGDNSTLNDMGVEASDAVEYAGFLSTLNVAQQSWKPKFFQDTAPYAWDPFVPGRYEYYLAAFDGATEVARTQITIISVDGTGLTLEADPCQTDQDLGTPGAQVAVNAWLRNPNDEDVTGYQAFVSYNTAAMTYVGASSTYNDSAFDTHIQPLSTAETPSGSGALRFDGNSATGSSGDEHLATLIFTVNECDLNSVEFDLTQAFDSEVSFMGTPLATSLLDSSTFLGDATGPVIAGTPADIVQPADSGSCANAVVTFTDPTASDNCDPSPTVVCDPPSGSVFNVGVTLVTCTATDACGNETTSTFNVTVTPTNSVDVVVQLVGSVDTTRCIQFVTDDCGSVANVPLAFVGGFANATIEVPCGAWTKLCAKDEQHTQWSESALVDSGAGYVASTTLVLNGGDTDNDGDVDINDVTLFLSQFGLPLPPPGGCPWDGATRDANFDNDGQIGALDYSFLAANWLTTSSCICSLPAGSGGVRERIKRSARVFDSRSDAVDLNRDGFVNVLDVELFEAKHGLSGELSARMRSSDR